MDTRRRSSFVRGEYFEVRFTTGISSGDNATKRTTGEKAKKCNECGIREWVEFALVSY